MNLDALMQQIKWYRHAKVGDDDERLRIIRAKIAEIIADCDTLAAGMLSPGAAAVAITKAIGVAERIKAASEPAKPPAVPDATTEPEPADDYDLVVVTNNKIDVWRYRRGRVLGETTLLRQPLNWRSAEATRDSWYGIKTGYRMFSSWTEAEKWIAGEAKPPAVPAATAKPEAVHPEPADAYDLVVATNIKSDAWRYRPGHDLGEHAPLKPPLKWMPAQQTRSDWSGNRPGYRMFGSWAEAERWIAGEVVVVGHATGGPKSAEYAEPAKPSTLADRVRAMMVHGDGTDWGQTIDNLARAINAVARAVDDLAKEAKP